MRKLLFLSLFLMTLFAGAQQFTTPLVKKGYASLSKNASLMRFLDSLDSHSEFITLDTAGFSVKGKPVPLVIIRHQEELYNENTRPNVLLFAQQHGNEPSGKEGLLLLAEEFAQGNLSQVLDSVNVLLMPQVNPDGGDAHTRRNAQNIDLNRDHLLMQAPETRSVENVFERYKPIVSVDIHEYYPYGKSWESFGYRRDFDIQVGALTNPNIAQSIIHYQRNKALPAVEIHLREYGYSFFEYTLGDFPDGERLRHSTTDINDGRQSIGITNTMSFIVEGMNGRDSTHRIRERALSQYETAKALISFTAGHIAEIEGLVSNAQQSITSQSRDSVIIRQDHFDSDEILNYPLRNVQTGKDTIFKVRNYFSHIKPLLKVKAPRGYLIRKSDTLIVKMLKHNHFDFTDYQRKKTDILLGQQIIEMRKVKNEGLMTPYPLVLDKFLNKLDAGKYYFVPTNQLRKYKLVIAFEPQSMFGIGFYEAFSVYMKKDTLFPAIRVE